MDTFIASIKYGVIAPNSTITQDLLRCRECASAKTSFLQTENVNY
jgi:hypothetical protein